ncbi:MarR family transcriptional regulator [Streptomyces sp. NK08204]|uniref:MarR family transcriptional regulator n=1 Tax=Streptomyces sp. NK08204 TaxID=2873260 RepID=UPI001CED040F|nr:MarR family transcriptional regulator [Streptomyces sp. NK08204]
MSDSRIALDRAGYALLSQTLTECGRNAVTGAVRVSGRPGGCFHLRNGHVVAVESPGAPGPEALLLRSGRVSAEQWDVLLGEPGAGRWPEEGLVAHGYAGAAQLRVVRMMALQDAVFAVVAGRVERVEPLTEWSLPPTAVAVGEAPLRLLQEATRKLTALAALPCPVLPDRERPVPAPGTDPDDERLPPVRRELLTRANGRRTARDLAFLTGRSVYPTTVELARMLADGLLTCLDSTTAALAIPVRTPPTGMLCPVRPRRAIGQVVRPEEAVPTRPPQPPQPPRELPRREPGTSGITESLASAEREAGWKGFFRLRHRIWSPDAGT